MIGLLRFRTKGFIKENPAILVNFWLKTGVKLANFEGLYLLNAEIDTRFFNCFRTVELSVFQNWSCFSVIVPPFRDIRRFLRPLIWLLVMAAALCAAAITKQTAARPQRSVKWVSGLSSELKMAERS